MQAPVTNWMVASSCIGSPFHWGNWAWKCARTRSSTFSWRMRMIRSAPPLARERLPELSVLFHVSKHREHRLKEFPVTSRRLLGRLALYGQARADVLESGRQEGLFVAVVRVEGGSAHVGAIEDVLNGEAFVPLF